MTSKKNNSGLVYSTEHGRMCPGCGRPIKQCTCTGKQTAPPSDGVVRVSRQTKGRKGKGVTLITGVPLGEAGIKALAKRLKQRCGSGGTVKDGVIEVQGDHCDLLMEELKKQGWTVKRAGG
ncbi:translation initiation factor-related protein YciH [Syntrophotalea carbinolica DSM 2380]|uniref:Translation initiation factor-related protein YciH n=1 Tax=Syntrophotalea carbinolica (strain DSM 2380 / NBRC 103641 / GraBd1) TaxID=338963 RepID=Q3A4I1_SYNC1|nr:translation initiation factor Sui1 [Syntrophotalea carbinolica]ABA88726.1 translation initiation factor-related protein YciH [Syntrophotalea carbinolica DSM 2380]